MKSLYESILDNEDVLIDDAKKSLNEFEIIRSLCKEGEFDKLTEMCNDGLLDKFIKDTLYINPKELNMTCSNSYLFYQICYSISNEKIVILDIKYSRKDDELIISVPNTKGINHYEQLGKLEGKLTEMYNKTSKISRDIKKLGFTKIKTYFIFLDRFEKKF